MLRRAACARRRLAVPPLPIVAVGGGQLHFVPERRIRRLQADERPALGARQLRHLGARGFYFYQKRL